MPNAEQAVYSSSHSYARRGRAEVYVQSLHSRPLVLSLTSMADRRISGSSGLISVLYRDGKYSLRIIDLFHGKKLISFERRHSILHLCTA